eukprot:1002328-Pleurochrysis_carterae.AAC.2
MGVQLTFAVRQSSVVEGRRLWSPLSVESGYVTVTRALAPPRPTDVRLVLSWRRQVDVDAEQVGVDMEKAVET